MAKNTKLIRVPREFEDMLKPYKEEAIKRDGYEIENSKAISKMMKEFNEMKNKLKDAELIIKRSRIY